MLRSETCDTTQGKVENTSTEQLMCKVPERQHYKREDGSTGRVLKSLRVCLKAREDNKEVGIIVGIRNLRDKQQHTRTQICWFFRKRQLSGNRK